MELIESQLGSLRVEKNTLQSGKKKYTKAPSKTVNIPSVRINLNTLSFSE